jgi:hypothetical protein
MNERRVRPKNTSPARKVPILDRKFWRKFYPVDQDKEGYKWTRARASALIYGHQQSPIAGNALNFNHELRQPSRDHQ